MIERLPETTHLLYSELLDGLLQAAYSKRGISFHQKTVSGNKYWYLDYAIGSEQHAYYLGPATDELTERVTEAKRRWERDAPDAERRARLVSMLVSGDATTISGSHARVLESLEQAGVFLVGGVLIGSHAFALMANMLGVKWPSSALRTQDVDIAQDYEIRVSVPDVDIDIEATLKSTDKGFFAVPALNPKHPSTAFKIRGKDLSVSLLTPMRGKPDAKPRRIPALDAMAEPLRFLEYLLVDVQPAAVPVRQGVLVNIPSPGRFALHKLVVSQRRQAAFAEKARKDIAQAAAVLEALFEDRPGDVLFALDAAREMPPKFWKQMQAGVEQLPDSIRNELFAALELDLLE